MMCPLPLDITLCRNYFSNKRALPPPYLRRHQPSATDATSHLSKTTAQHTTTTSRTSPLSASPVQSKDGMVSPTPRLMIARAAGDFSLLMPACSAAALFVSSSDLCRTCAAAVGVIYSSNGEFYKPILAQMSRALCRLNAQYSHLLAASLIAAIAHVVIEIGRGFITSPHRGAAAVVVGIGGAPRGWCTNVNSTVQL